MEQKITKKDVNKVNNALSRVVVYNLEWVDILMKLVNEAKQNKENKNGRE